VALADLEPLLARRIEAARTASGWDAQALGRVVAHEYDVLGPFVSARIETGQDGREYLRTEFNPPQGRDLEAAERDYDRGCEKANEGNLSGALQVFERLVGVFPEVPKYHEALGQALHELGRIDEAEAVLWQAVELDPEVPRALGLLGRIYLQWGDVKLAIEMMQASLELVPHPIIFTNLGAAFGKAGRLREAVGAFEEALKLDPQFLDAQRGLRIAKEQLNRRR